MRSLVSILLVVTLAASTAHAASFPSCDSLEGKLNEYRDDISGIENALDAVKTLANVIDPLGAISCEAKEDLCKLSSTLTLIDTIGSKLKGIPNIGPVMNTMSITAKAANIDAKLMCNEAKVLCDTVPGSSTLARVYIQQYPNMKTVLKAVDGVCAAGLATVDTATTAATPFCDGSDVDSSCASVLSEIESAEDAAQRLKEQVEKLVSQQLQAALQQMLTLLNSVAGSLDGIMPTFDVLDDIFSGLDALNLPGMPACTPAIPKVCTPGVPKQCATVKYPCGVKTKCCGKIAGKCVCKKPVTKWCDHQECTPAVPEQCTPAVPEFCPMDVAIDALFDALGISGIPALPGLGFLNVGIPELPDFGFYSLDISIDIPNILEEISLDLPALPGIDFDVPDVTFSFPTCLAA